MTALIMDTDAVSYICTFDNYMVGTIQGQYNQGSV
jgi:ABC-type xylose transport system substrate-binding protein